MTVPVPANPDKPDTCADEINFLPAPALINRISKLTMQFYAKNAENSI
jgi:hypothetical protein